MPAFSLTDGVTTVSLNGGPIWTQNYPLQSAGSGPEASGEISDSLDLLFTGANPSTVQAHMRSVEAMLESAKQRAQSGVGRRVYLLAQYDNEADAWRSEVIEGVLLSEAGPGQIWRNVVEARLSVMRRAFWEGPEDELSISANGQSAVTGGRTVTNNGSGNWIEVAAAQVGGVLPAGARLRLRNTTGSAKSYKQIYAGVNALGGSGTFAGQALQGQGRVAGYGTVISDGASSGGQYLRMDAPVSPQVGAMWALAGGLMGAGGRRFRLLVRFTAYNTALRPRVQPAIYDGDGVYRLWLGEEALLASAGASPIVDLGSVPLPPGVVDTGYAPVRLALLVRAGSATTVGVDYLNLVGLDGWRDVANTGPAVANNEAVEIDDLDGRHGLTTASGKLASLTPRGKGLVLYPGRQQRIHILHMNTLEAAPVTETWSAQLFYRPRRPGL